MGRNFALTAPQVKEAATMYAKGYSVRDLAAHFDKSEGAVKSALRLAGVKLRDRKTAVEVALLRRYIHKPAPPRRGWDWLHPENAHAWGLNQMGRPIQQGIYG